MRCLRCFTDNISAGHECTGECLVCGEAIRLRVSVVDEHGSLSLPTGEHFCSRQRRKPLTAVNTQGSK